MSINPYLYAVGAAVTAILIYWFFYKVGPQESGIGHIVLSGTRFEIKPLTIERMDRVLLWIEAAIDPSIPYSRTRILAGASRVLRVACPDLSARTLKNAPAAEVEKAFHEVMNLWKLTKA